MNVDKRRLEIGGVGLLESILQKAARENFAEKMSGVDLILTDSRTHGVLPAISLYRGLGEPIVDEKVVAIFSDRPIDCRIEQFPIDDIDAAVRVCLFLCEGGGAH